MKRILTLLLILVCAAGMAGCAESKMEPYVVNTVEQISAGQVDEAIARGDVLVLKTHYEMSDGTWKTDEYTYQYRLEITGRLNNAVKDTTYIVLSNTKDITFEQTWKASGLSSNLEDYFQPENADIVGMR